MWGWWVAGADRACARGGGGKWPEPVERRGGKCPGCHKKDRVPCRHLPLAHQLLMCQGCYCFLHSAQKRCWPLYYEITCWYKFWNRILWKWVESSHVFYRRHTALPIVMGNMLWIIFDKILCPESGKGGSWKWLCQLSIHSASWFLLWPENQKAFLNQNRSSFNPVISNTAVLVKATERFCFYFKDGGGGRPTRFKTLNTAPKLNLCPPESCHFSSFFFFFGGRGGRQRLSFKLKDLLKGWL